MFTVLALSDIRFQAHLLTYCNKQPFLGELGSNMVLFLEKKNMALNLTENFQRVVGGGNC